MGCNCKNIIENFQGGQIPLSTTFLSSVSFNSAVSIAGTLTSNGMSVFNGLNYFIVPMTAIIFHSTTFLMYFFITPL